MSIDVLKTKIRKLRNPSALTIAPTFDTMPPQVMTEFDKKTYISGASQPCVVRLSITQYERFTTFEPVSPYNQMGSHTAN